MTIEAFKKKLGGQDHVIQGWEEYHTGTLAIEDGMVREPEASSSSKDSQPTTTIRDGDDELNHQCEVASCRAMREIAGVRNRTGAYPKNADFSRVPRHLDRGTIHRGHISDPNKLGCGKPLGPKYEILGMVPEDAYPICGD